MGRSAWDRLKLGYSTEDRGGRRCPGLPLTSRELRPAARGRHNLATQQFSHEKRRKNTLNSYNLGKQILLHPTFLLPSLIFSFLP